MVRGMVIIMVVMGDKYWLWGWWYEIKMRMMMMMKIMMLIMRSIRMMGKMKMMRIMVMIWDKDNDDDEDYVDDGRHGELLGVVWLRWQQETNNHLGKITYPSLGDILSLWEILYTTTWTPFFLKNFITIPLFVSIIFTTFTFFSFGSRWVLVLPRSSTRTTLTWELAIGAVSVSIYGLRQWSMLKNLCNW